MITWVNFLHIYQPPYQDPEVVQQVSKESYWQLVNILKKNKNAKITLNFSGCLLEHLYSVGQEKLIEEFKQLVAGRQIELVGSARYHPILPLLPPNEIKRQIELNDQILKQAFDDLYHPTGFFLPEMAYNANVAKIIKKLGYKWIILDEIAYKGRLGLVDYNKKYKIKNIGLMVAFRNRDISKTFVPDTILSLTKKSNPPNFLITATDGEMYGHHHHDWQNVFEQILKNNQVRTKTVSEYLELSMPTESVTPLASSWESTPQELKRKLPYALWQNPKNKIHQNLWDLRKIAIRVVSASKEKGPNYDWARHHLDRGLASCAWWWAADRKLDLFDFVTWNPDAVEKGIKELISSIRSLHNVSQKTKLEAEKLYHLLIKEIWKKHWKKYHKTQPEAKKMSTEIRRGLSLLDQNFLIKLFKKHVAPQIIGKDEISYIAINTFKQKIGQQSFYHIVARYEVHFKNKKMKPVVIFCNSNSKEPRQGAFEALDHLWKNDFSKGNLMCPQPLFFLKRYKAMFYLEASGKNLYQYIIDPQTKFRELKNIVKLSGRWLAKLHNLPTDKVKNFNPAHSKISTILPGPKHFLKSIDIKHNKYPKYHDQTEKLFHKINNLEKKWGFDEQYIIHGDFHPENVIYNKQNNLLLAIDYTDCCLGHYARDLASFIQQLGYMSRKNISYLQIKKLQKIFLQSYLKRRKIKLKTKDHNRLNLYKAWTSLRSAIFFLTVSTFDRPRADALFEETKGYLKKIK
ncbi:phosphotransferase [Patescibacteria group bacterium]|nr:phosphotransferase [Patescibacteria group bacterium]